ncbi:hypothetical protein Ae201684P_011277 [Aphanomyces euteiches]|nr:hypothetical protein Ae201684P_011277 [Aphanomyces euteiches]
MLGLRTAVLAASTSWTNVLSIWESVAFNITGQPIVHLASFNFTNGGSYAFRLDATVGGWSLYGSEVNLVVCDAAAFAAMQSRGYPRHSHSLCARYPPDQTESMLESLCSVYPVDAHSSSQVALNSANALTGGDYFTSNAVSAQIDLDARVIESGMQHFLLDVCQVACASDDCINDLSTIRVAATLLFAMCDAGSPRRCTGVNVFALGDVCAAFGLAWVAAAVAWATHLRRRTGPIYKLQAFMTLTLVAKVAQALSMLASFHVAAIDVALSCLHLAASLALGVGCLMMIVLFGLADGCGIVGRHDRGYMLAILYFGYPLIENANNWNPILSAIMVVCVLFMLTKLTGRRLGELHEYAYSIQRAGVNPDATAVGTKVRFFRAIRMYSFLFFLETYFVRVIFFCIPDSSGWMSFTLLESITFLFFVAMGYTFRCRHFEYAVNESMPSPRSSRILPIVVILPRQTQARPPKVFTHPDGSRAFGSLCAQELSLQARGVYDASASPVQVFANFSFTQGGAFVISVASLAYLGRQDSPSLTVLVCEETVLHNLQLDKFNVSTCGGTTWRPDDCPLVFKINKTAPSSACCSFDKFGTIFQVIRYSNTSFTGTKVFLLDACPLLSSDTRTLPIRIDFAMCDGLGHCTGEIAAYLASYHGALCAGWGVLLLTWILHLRQKKDLRHWLHVVFLGILAAKVIQMISLCLATRSSQLIVELASPTMLIAAEWARRTVALVLLAWLFGLADGWNLLWHNPRGCIFAVPFSGYPIVDAWQTWNPMLAGCNVAAILLLLHSLASKRVRRLLYSCQLLQESGVDPVTTPVMTKLTLLRRLVFISSIYFVGKFTLDLTAYYKWKAHELLLEGIHEVMMTAFFIALGWTFRCRHFVFVERRTARPVDIVRQDEPMHIMLLHPDGSQNLAKRAYPLRATPQTV